MSAALETCMHFADCGAPALDVLRSWGCTVAEAAAVLRPGDPGVSARAAWICEFDTLFRSTFHNPENIFCFARMENYNQGFNGRSLVDVLIGADLSVFEETFLRLVSVMGVPAPVSVAQVAHIRSLVDGVEIDLDAPLPDDEPDDAD